MRPAGGVGEGACHHTQLAGALGHADGKGLFRARQAFCQDDAGVVARLHDDAADQVLHPNVVTLAQEHFGAAHLPGAGGDAEAVVERQSPFLERLEDHVERHQLGHGRRGQGGLRVLFQQDRSGGVVDHQRGAGFGVERKRGQCGGGEGKRAREAVSKGADQRHLSDLCRRLLDREGVGIAHLADRAQCGTAAAFIAEGTGDDSEEGSTGIAGAFANPGAVARIVELLDRRLSRGTVGAGRDLEIRQLQIAADAGGRLSRRNQGVEFILRSRCRWLRDRSRFGFRCGGGFAAVKRVEYRGFQRLCRERRDSSVGSLRGPGCCGNRGSVAVFLCVGRRRFARFRAAPRSVRFVTTTTCRRAGAPGSIPSGSAASDETMIGGPGRPSSTLKSAPSIWRSLSRLVIRTRSALMSSRTATQRPPSEGRPSQRPRAASS